MPGTSPLDNAQDGDELHLDCRYRKLRKQPTLVLLRTFRKSSAYLPRRIESVTNFHSRGFLQNRPNFGINGEDLRIVLVKPIGKPIMVFLRVVHDVVGLFHMRYQILNAMITAQTAVTQLAKVLRLMVSFMSFSLLV